MNSDSTGLVFGPVPSRRLGRSLGINNIPPKVCSYSCIYCQLGPTAQTEIAPRTFFPPQEIRRAVESRLQELNALGERVDYLTFVPDGEPTLDEHLGEAIELLRPLGIPIAVISNASLLWREEVRERLAKADWVSLKLDAVEEPVWRRINRADPALNLRGIMDGMLRFANLYRGVLVTETMLLYGINDHLESVSAVAEFLERLRPRKAYLAVPTRPPAEPAVRGPSEQAFVRAYTVFASRLAEAECLTGFEGTEFPCSGDAERNLLAITAVHPLRDDAARQFLLSAGLDETFLTSLVAQGKLRRVEYAGKHFFVRRLSAEG